MHKGFSVTLIAIFLTAVISSFCFFHLPMEANHEITVVNNRDNLLLYLSLDEKFNDKVIQAIKSGVETSFTFTIKIELIRNGWFNKTIDEIKTTNSIKFDSLKNQYRITKKYADDKPPTTDDLGKAIKKVKEIEGFEIIKMNRLKKGERYRIKVKSELDNYSLPYYLDYILFFLSFNDFQTNWYYVDFLY